MTRTQLIIEAVLIVFVFPLLLLAFAVVTP